MWPALEHVDHMHDHPDNMQIGGCGMTKMIQIRHVPDALHRRLKARAADAGMTLSDFLLAELRKVAERPTPRQLWERLRSREPFEPSIPPADLIREERDGARDGRDRGEG
jgi:hypothetical protein